MSFNATSSFRMKLYNDDSGRADPVTVQVGLDGLKLCDASSGRSLRSYKLGDISRWRAAPTSLTLHTRTAMDVEESQVVLQGDEYTTRSLLDVLTCSCMQLAELLQSKQSGDDQENETANSLHALVAGNGKKKTKLPAVEDVEYWHSAEKEGWMQTQGDYLSTWRKRWFVLKQGYLFRFMNNNVSEHAKPRGVVDLSKIQDVRPASSIINRPNSIQLKTATGGSVAYICESETDMVLWLSAIQESIQRIIKLVAGVEEEPSARPAGKGGSSSKRSEPSSEWVRQLEKSMAGSGGPAPSLGGSTMVDVVGYESVGNGDDAAASSSGRPAGGSDLSYGQIAGVAGVANGGGLGADTMLNYGGGLGADALSPPPDGYGGGMATSSAYAAMPAPMAGSAYPYQAPGSFPSYPVPGQAGGMYPSPGQGYSATPSAFSQAPAAPASLIDSVPQQQPAYPYFQQGLPPVQASVASAPVQHSWQVHYTADGRPYYYNASTGTTQWEAPPVS